MPLSYSYLFLCGRTQYYQKILVGISTYRQYVAGLWSEFPPKQNHGRPWTIMDHEPSWQIANGQAMPMADG